MRPQPSVDTVLRAAAESLDGAARETNDIPLRAHVLSPVAGLLRQIADCLDTYVADRLIEIDRLAVLAAASAEILPAEERVDLARLLDDARSTSGYLPASHLDELADALHRELIAVQEKIQEGRYRGGQVIADRIWAEQTGGRPAART
jgi:hypothetical protein